MMFATWKRLAGVLLLAMGIGMPMASAAAKDVLPEPVQAPVNVPVLPAEPVLNGEINGDLAWRTIQRIPFNPSNPNVDFFKVGWRPTSNNFYVGIFSTSLPPSANNRIVLGFVTHAQSEWRIHLHSPAGSGPPPATPPIKVWRDAATWNNSGSMPVNPTPSWVAAGARFLVVPGRYWSLEFKIKINSGFNSNGGIYFPGQGVPFSMYINMMNGSNPGSGSTVQKPWPHTVPMNGPWEQSTPAVNQWGTATQL